MTHARGLGAAKVGAIGYCLGGLLAYLAACRTDADASVGYYGVAIPNFLGEAANIKKPLTLHVAGKDSFVSPAAQQQMRDGLASNPLVTLHSIPSKITPSPERAACTTTPTPRASPMRGRWHFLESIWHEIWSDSDLRVCPRGMR
ncbi:MAG: dienelactone hydrolase family protein [Terricaulis sp.]